MKTRKLAQGGALGGLDTVNQGAGQIGDSLKMIQEGLSGGGGNSNPTPDPAGRFDSEQSLKKLGVMLKKGGKVVSASRRGDGIAAKGKTRGRMV
jgi:hypothetical protein